MQDALDVYIVDHWYELDSGEDVVRTIGIYSSEATADEAIERARLLPGFRDRPHDFHVNRFSVGQDNWSEGFISGQNS
ncbi:hypothetical protein ACFYTF_00490 [Nocardia thailandica]|uniref:DUF7336 domain-containing protein n=1 Tax=Nocardia thailandica TaxID=257275 RepID=A0ABW6PFX0_9NOCA